ncbi:hypothetical protein [Vibrio parahaemolyticus]|uniref:hypothetical protein n=2 Tax=Vibrio parahaemolyticus TaxID=670 RepID=UPI0003A61A53|nr:hypothetical protein [Vibrio parahaemolyticus]MDW1969469.1 hypothetical protein [Vibrio sp. 945]AYO03598.1 hypothetical protein D0871_04365 [Vibrio parahaemolyticus]EGR1188857.1 hypothetical protein [Vibrio parahaemolyticus]EGR1233631.1 hypothetical protein [Vibrio parahaemolyticus]EHR0229191.1 hypothetical protein [Vibrio parahaemolyticus]
MKQADKIVLSGLASNNVLGGISLVQSFTTAKTLLANLPKEQLLLEHFEGSYERSVNKNRLQVLTTLFKNSVEQNAPLCIPSVSMFILGEVQCEYLDKNLATLQFSPSKTTVIDGFLTISALGQLLGLIDPITNKKKKNSNILTAAQKQTLASIDIQINLYFQRNGKNSEETAAKLFFDVNTTESKLYSQYIATHEQESPLIAGAEKLSKALELNDLGGVSEFNKITKSDSFVTTKNTLVQVILASLGGKNIRIEKRLPTHLTNKSAITNSLVDQALKALIPLMQGWLSYVAPQLKQGSNGFHRSMQTWQALGVVTYHLTQNTTLTTQQLFDAGQRLGQLDYGKSAKHWENCNAFKKDATGQYWINATGGGRTFRDKMADYFIEVLKV